MIVECRDQLQPREPIVCSEVLVRDNHGNPIVLVFAYGRGQVFCVRVGEPRFDELLWQHFREQGPEVEQVRLAQPGSPLVLP